MADEIPSIPKAGSFYVHTGNIVNWNRLKRKLTQSPSEELTECISSTIRDWHKEADKNVLQFETDVVVLNSKFLEKLPEDDRDGLKLTVKIFVTKLERSSITEAVEKASCELGTNYIETVLLSVPENKVHLDDLKPLWEALEALKNEDKVLSLGVADLSKDQLEELFNWAQVKPCIAQVNLSSCCVVPPEMQEFAKENDIQLLTHNDPQDILSSKDFQDVVAANVTQRDADGWQLSWLNRYSVLIKARGVIKTKGYILKAERDTKKRK